MPKRPSPPSYRQHKNTGLAVVTLVDPVTKRRHDVYLGHYGTPESHREFDRVVSEWMAAGRRLESPAGAPGSGLSVAQLLPPFWRHVDEDYPPKSTERKNFTAPLRLLRESYVHTPAAEFDALKLKALRAEMVKRGWCRNRVNREVGRVKTCFKWAAGEKLIPGKVYFDLAVLRALPPNAPGVKHFAPRRPAYLADVEPALGVMRPAGAALVRLIALTGARPSELLTIRMQDIDREDPALWRYTPGSDAGPYGRHKNAWRGQTRVVTLGPKCLEILRPWLREDDPTAFLFSPAATMRHWNQTRREGRRSPLTPSAQARYSRAATPSCRKRAPGSHYTAQALGNALRRACVKAGIGPVTLYAFRHGRKMEVMREHGSDAARAVLGQRSIDSTTHYGELDFATAAAVQRHDG